MSELLSAHSITEAQLYIKVTPCPECDKGPVQLEEITRHDPHIDVVLQCACRCAACGRPILQRFKVDAQWAADREQPVINPTARPSELIDVAQWLTLHHVLLADAESAPDRELKRRMKHLAGLSIDEALKFYGEDNDLPPPSAFYSAKNSQHARTHPELFARQSLLSMRSRLPRAWGTGGLGQIP